MEDYIVSLVDEAYLRKYGLKIRLSPPLINSFFIEHLDFFLLLDQSSVDMLMSAGISSYSPVMNEKEEYAASCVWADARMMAEATNIAYDVIQDPIINAQIQATEFLRPASIKAIEQTFARKLATAFGFAPLIICVLLDRIPKKLAASLMSLPHHPNSQSA